MPVQCELRQAFTHIDSSINQKHVSRVRFSTNNHPHQMTDILHSFVKASLIRSSCHSIHLTCFNSSSPESSSSGENRGSLCSLVATQSVNHRWTKTHFRRTLGEEE